MNKKKVDELIPRAYEILGGKDGVGLKIMGSDGKKNGKWRAQIASFGASIAMGSLRAAVSLFSAQGGAEVDRAKLMQAIAALIGCEGTLYEYVSDAKGEDERKAKEEILNAAVALKLAMNLYDLGKGEKQNAESRGNEPELPAE